MREWVWELDEIDRDCVFQYEQLLGRQLKDRAEYTEIDGQVDEMILEWDSRKEFFAAYPKLIKYAAIEAITPSVEKEEEGNFMELVRDNVKVEWVALGEGLYGDYNWTIPDDIELLRFDVSVLREGQWIEKEDASYCTRFPADATDAEKRAGLELLMKRFHEVLHSDPEASVKKLGEELSWISLDSISRVALNYEPAQELRVSTKLGEIVVTVKTDCEYPGIFVDLKGENLNDKFEKGTVSLAVIEYDPYKNKVQNVVYGDGNGDDYTHLVEYENLLAPDLERVGLNEQIETAAKTVQTNAVSGRNGMDGLGGR